MTTHILLLRGINVGGRNKLPMKELVAQLEALGCRDVRTYIQSGNAVFRGARKLAASLPKQLAEALEASHGFAPHALVLDFAELEAAMRENPFPEAESDPKGLHVGFLDARPKSPDLDALEALRAKSERFELVGTRFYLHAPDGVGRSKLAARAEKLLGVAMTDRNWRTVGKLHELGAALG